MVAAPQKTETLANLNPDASAPVPPTGDGISYQPYVYSSLIDSNTDIKINALYDPRLLYDYGGSVFDHTQAKLVQCHFTDCTGALIPPLDEYDNLRTGTVVLIRVSLKIYCIETLPKLESCIKFTLTESESFYLRINLSTFGAIKNIDVDGPDKISETHDSDVEAFENLVVAIMLNSQTLQRRRGTD
ncbi:hypothetical protein BGY98DRAFT_1092587 [Russula aff. rugulosa BPL654]|nr:hypothetical protein BGY98DRAFT_1092587 [Russula aff. rugulosa BPL654]